MSYLAVRIYAAGIADVLAFKTKREAERWVKDTLTFWTVAIKRKQVHIEYIGRYGLAAGYYLGATPTVHQKFREEQKHGETEELS